MWCIPALGYALYRTATQSSARKIYYYRCLGSDAWRYAGHARCTERPIRQDPLENLVWCELMRLLEDPTLIEAELQRRLEAARSASPIKRREATLHRELTQSRKRMERLLTAYQEELLSLDELRRRMPDLRQREQRLQTELNTLQAQVADQAAYLRLAQTLSAFLESLRAHAQTLDVQERQRITRLLVKEVVVGHDSITIRHSIPNAVRSNGSPGMSGASGPADKTGSDEDYLLCPWRDGTSLRCTTMLILGVSTAAPASWRALNHWCVEPGADYRKHGAVGNAPRDTAHQIPVRNGVEIVR